MYFNFDFTYERYKYEWSLHPYYGYGTAYVIQFNLGKSSFHLHWKYSTWKVIIYSPNIIPVATAFQWPQIIEFCSLTLYESFRNIHCKSSNGILAYQGLVNGFSILVYFVGSVCAIIIIACDSLSSFFLVIIHRG